MKDIVSCMEASAMSKVFSPGGGGGPSTRWETATTGSVAGTARLYVLHCTRRD